MELVEQGGGAVVDVPGAVVGMEAADGEGEGEGQRFQDGQQEAFADADLGGPRLADGDPLAQTGLGLAEVVDVAVGKGCQPLVARNTFLRSDSYVVGKG